MLREGYKILSGKTGNLTSLYARGKAMVIYRRDAWVKGKRFKVGWLRSRRLPLIVFDGSGEGFRTACRIFSKTAFYYEPQLWLVGYEPGEPFPPGVIFDAEKNVYLIKEKGIYVPNFGQEWPDYTDFARRLKLIEPIDLVTIHTAELRERASRRLAYD